MKALQRSEPRRARAGLRRMRIKTPPLLFDRSQKLIERIQPLVPGTFLTYWMSTSGSVCDNDVMALQSPGALQAAAASGAAVCLMHMQGTPRTMQAEPRYAHVVPEVENFLRGRVAACVAAGIPPDRIAIDPGFGFGKTMEHNLELLAGLEQIADGPSPVLVGLSRKSMLGKLTGRPVEERLPGSLALATIATLHGARIVRAHDVAATRDAVRVAWATRQFQEQQ